MSKVSVIIPVFNQEKYIGRCLRSIIKQSLSSNLFEVIVIDDSSKDKSMAIIKKFSKNIKIFTNDSNKGLPYTLNKAIKIADGSFIVRLDADDYVNEFFLQYLRDFLVANNNIDAIATDYLKVDDRENIISRNNCLKDPIACGIMFRIEQLIEIGLYDETFLSREEQDLRARFEKRYKIHRLELPLYRYRRHKNNMTNDNSRMKYFQNKLEKKHN